MKFEFVVDGARRTIALEKKGGLCIVQEGRAVFEAEIRRVSENEFLFLAPGRTAKVYLARDGERRLVSAGGRVFTLTEAGRDPDRFGGGEDGPSKADSSIKAPMPGKVIKVCVAEGERVRKNQSLVIVEAMKMENDLRAAAAGVVTKIHVRAGDIVDAAKTLLELEPET